MQLRYIFQPNLDSNRTGKVSFGSTVKTHISHLIAENFHTKKYIFMFLPTISSQNLLLCVSKINLNHEDVYEILDIFGLDVYEILDIFGLCG